MNGRLFTLAVVIIICIFFFSLIEFNPFDLEYDKDNGVVGWIKTFCLLIIIGTASYEAYELIDQSKVFKPETVYISAAGEHSGGKGTAIPESAVGILRKDGNGKQYKYIDTTGENITYYDSAGTNPEKDVRVKRKIENGVTREKTTTITELSGPENGSEKVITEYYDENGRILIIFFYKI